MKNYTHYATGSCTIVGKPSWNYASGPGLISRVGHTNRSPWAGRPTQPSIIPRFGE